MADLGRATGKMAGFVRAQVGEGAASRVAGLGYSNGANILAAVQFAAPELFDAAVLLHPLIPFDPGPVPGLAGKRVLITAGRHDPICPPEATERLANWYGAQGAAVELFWHAGGHELRNEELAKVRSFLSA
jgi:phospholipase/carboxylesterase